MSLHFFLYLLAYSFSLWLGLYLLSYNFSNVGLRYAGLGLVSYACSLAVGYFQQIASSAIWVVFTLGIPAVFWTLATLHLWAQDTLPTTRLHTTLLGTLTVAVLFVTGYEPVIGRWSAVSLPIVLLSVGGWRFVYAWRVGNLHPPMTILLTFILFFVLSSSLVLLPLGFIQDEIGLLLISIDMALLGYAVVVMDAYHEGTAFRRDIYRAGLLNLTAFAILGGQIVMVMMITDDHLLILQVLLFTVITSVLMILAFYDAIQNWFDHRLLSNIADEREALRAANEALAKTDETLEVYQLTQAEFIRLTRRALSHYSYVNKLASSPLMGLPMVIQKAESDHILVRAHALKIILREAIEQLKPLESQLEGDITDEWRYYNVLYFPYVLGLKPYTRWTELKQLSPIEARVQEWFMTSVPERTLYNWQSTAAKLVAIHLWEQLHPKS